MIKLVGGYGSPYTNKMRAVLRYRRIPFQWVRRGAAEDVDIPPVPVALIPVLVHPAADGEQQAMVDSTFEIKKLEELFDARSLIHPDPAIAFIDALIEDYADEWLTKPMFHYRWKYPADIYKASHVLLLDRNCGLSRDALERAAKFFAERQIARLGVVGSNDVTTPVIEASYQRLLKLLDAHLKEHSFLFGSRPGVGDFGLFGQLTQLVQFDPTPSAIAIEQAPRVYSWLTWMSDLGSLATDEKGWLSREGFAATVTALLDEIGRVYVPFLLANLRALESKATEVGCEIDGRPWVQQPFSYQGKCLKWLREGHAALSSADRAWVDSKLSNTGCTKLFF